MLILMVRLLNTYFNGKTVEHIFQWLDCWTSISIVRMLNIYSNGKTVNTYSNSKTVKQPIQE